MNKKLHIKIKCNFKLKKHNVIIKKTIYFDIYFPKHIQ